MPGRRPHGPAGAGGLGPREIGPPQALPILRAALLGPSHQLRETAADALSAMGPSGVDVLTQVAAGDDCGAATAARVLASRHDLARSPA